MTLAVGMQQGLVPTARQIALQAAKGISRVIIIIRHFIAQLTAKKKTALFLPC